MFRRKEENAESGSSTTPSVTSPASGSGLSGSSQSGSGQSGLGMSGSGQSGSGQSGSGQAGSGMTGSAPARSEASSSASHSDSAQAASGQAAHAGNSASNAPYVPTARASSPASSPSASEPVRNAAPQGAGYRPTPIAEFNRGAARAAPDALRNSGNAGGASSSFGGAPEKAAAAKTSRRVLTVGNDILLKGEIATCDRLVIEGRVEAKLSEVHTVEIAECGSFKGTAEVEDAEISGIFEGDLVVRNRLVIYATGEVRGNIGYGEIEIERGGKLTGQIKTVVTGAQGAKAKTADIAANAEKRPAAKESAAA